MWTYAVCGLGTHNLLPKRCTEATVQPVKMKQTGLVRSLSHHSGAWLGIRATADLPALVHNTQFSALATCKQECCHLVYRCCISKTCRHGFEKRLADRYGLHEKPHGKAES